MFKLIKKIFFYFFIIFFIFINFKVYAQTYENVLQYVEPKSDFNLDLKITTLKFILIILVFIIIVFILKKYALKFSNPNYTDNIKILDYQLLVDNKYIFIVEIYTKIFILGVSNNYISVISEITDKETINEIKLKTNQNIKNKNFSEYLNQLININNSK